MSPFSMPSTQILLVTPPRACHLHNLRNISAENTCILFTLGTRYMSCFFRSTKAWLPPLYRLMSKRSSSQYPTILRISYDFFQIQSVTILSWTGAQVIAVSFFNLEQYHSKEHKMNIKISLWSNYRFTSLKKRLNGKYTVCTGPSHDHNWSYLEKMLPCWLGLQNIPMLLCRG